MQNKISLKILSAFFLLGAGFAAPSTANETLSPEEVKILRQMLADYESNQSPTLSINTKNKQEITAKAKILFLQGSTSEPFNYTVFQSNGSNEDCDNNYCLVESVDDPSGTGFELEIGYKPENSPFFAFGTYRQLIANATDSFKLNEGEAGGLFEFTDEPQEERCDSSEAPCDVSGSQSLFVDKWTLGAGMEFKPTNYLSLSPSIALTKVFAGESRNSSSEAIQTSGGPNTVSSSSKYDGWGPQLGLDANIQIIENLTVSVGTSAAMTYGHISSSYKNVDSSSPSVVSASQSSWVPALGAGIEINYDIDLTESLVLSLSGGYEVDYLIGATSIIGSNSYDQEDSGEFMGSKGNILFNGFNLGIGMTYKF